ncbi:MAG: hypothetical protein F6J93_22355 [Oscillatoria sp. SIO1A7]|nr:hypothetical protein [Oscillatoria sp. SIO1A7]
MWEDRLVWEVWEGWEDKRDERYTGLLIFYVWLFNRILSNLFKYLMISIRHAWLSARTGDRCGI